ncbi:hypothetical protein [Bradyrhizobium cenepequi]|uniref:hypothetical protein n=1 Tax=Bradyrhizobium cenepequi TaxID=2821403 RepID=UPI001CE2F4DA|nr:hypothetical protein [Bradyrhizobium cenepequi]MCA6108169.1 hypothetical protein [Bradyrhizobium cenepequi]
MRTPPKDSPFLPGTRVAIRVSGSRWSHIPDTFTEGFVEKSYKNGNFVLRGSSQQYRPHSPGGMTKHWTAYQTGEGSYFRGEVRVWDDAAEEEIAQQKARYALYKRFSESQEIIKATRWDDDINPDIVAKLEAAATAITGVVGT